MQLQEELRLMCTFFGHHSQLLGRVLLSGGREVLGYQPSD